MPKTFKDLIRRERLACDAVAMVYDVDPLYLVPSGKNMRTPMRMTQAAFTQARWVMFTAMADVGKSSLYIGSAFNRDNSTVLNGIRRTKARLADGCPLAIEAYNLAIDMLKNG